MLGFDGAGWHLEFTHCRTHPVAPAPTAEDLVVLYLPEAAGWEAANARMAAAIPSSLPRSVRLRLSAITAS